MISTDRFLEGALLFLKGKIKLDYRGIGIDYFIIEKNNVQLGEKITCTCEFGSIWGVKKEQSCRHIIACQFYHAFMPLIKHRQLKIQFKKGKEFKEVKNE